MSERAGCGGCSATWTGQRMCHCGGCHETFAGLALFDVHRRGSRCTNPASLVSLRLVDGVWRGPERDPATIPAASS